MKFESNREYMGNLSLHQQLLMGNKIHNKLERVLSTDMSKAFDSLDFPLLIAKLRAYGFSRTFSAEKWTTFGL